jgi:hypothetical protein
MLALFGSVCALLLWWRAHRRSMLALSRPGVAWWPPSADLTACPAALRAGAEIKGLLGHTGIGGVGGVESPERFRVFRG